MNEERLSHLSTIYGQAERHYFINPRTFQWYITEKIIPQPVHKGREAYYEDESKILSYLEVIRDLKFIRASSGNLIDISIAKIKRIIEHHKKEIDKLASLLDVLLGEFPTWNYDQRESLTTRDRNSITLPGYGRFNRKNVRVQQKVIDELLKGGTLDKIGIVNVAEQVDKEFEERGARRDSHS